MELFPKLHVEEQFFEEVPKRAEPRLEEVTVRDYWILLRKDAKREVYLVAQLHLNEPAEELNEMGVEVAYSIEEQYYVILEERLLE